MSSWGSWGGKVVEGGSDQRLSVWGAGRGACVCWLAHKYKAERGMGGKRQIKYSKKRDSEKQKENHTERQRHRHSKAENREESRNHETGMWRWDRRTQKD